MPAFDQFVPSQAFIMQRGENNDPLGCEFPAIGYINDVLKQSFKSALMSSIWTTCILSGESVKIFSEMSFGSGRFCLF